MKTIQVTIKIQLENDVDPDEILSEIISALEYDGVSDVEIENCKEVN